MWQALWRKAAKEIGEEMFALARAEEAEGSILRISEYRLSQNPRKTEGHLQIVKRAQYMVGKAHDSLYLYSRIEEDRRGPTCLSGAAQKTKAP
jgi:hypothetical protein